jgi:hypothetical protein
LWCSMSRITGFIKSFCLENTVWAKVSLKVSWP